MGKQFLFAGIITIALYFFPLPAKAQVIHEGAAGDTFKKISKQYDVTVDSLARLNGLQPNAGLVIGQALLAY